MWTQRKTDMMVLHAENEVDEALKKFLRVYFAERMPTPEEISAVMGIPVEDVVRSLEEETD